MWLPDGNIHYFYGKHIPIAIVAILIVLVGISYTLLLFFWQWIMRTSHHNCFSRWIWDTKLNAIIMTYHAPYSYEYRFWTGLSLIVRVVLYLTAAVTESRSPRVPLLMTLLLMSFLLLLKGAIGTRIYKKISVDIVETVILINLLVYSGFSLYKFNSDGKIQALIAYSSTAIMFLILLGVIVYHIIAICKKTIQARYARNECYTPLVQPTEHAELASETKITYSTLNIPNDSLTDNVHANDEGH